MALTHKVFEGSSFREFGYQRDNLLAHAFSVELYAGSRDLKAPELAKMYVEHKTSVPQHKVARVNEVLDYMNEMQTSLGSGFRTKWGFVDIFWVISEHLPILPRPRTLADRYTHFERMRLKHTRAPAGLIGVPGSEDKDLYNYIVAFNSDGATKENLQIRHAVLIKRLL
jgi:hypothetical protein